MHILRWLLKHPILLAWALAVLAILLNFADMSSKKGAEQEGSVVVAEQSAEVLDPDQNVQVTADMMGIGTPNEEADERAMESGTEIANEEAYEQGVESGIAIASAEIAQDEMDGSAAANKPQSVPVAAPPAAAPQVAEATASAPQDDMLRAAREAYWSNELDRAVELYQTLIQQEPDRLDYKGELANVFWKQGKSEDAAVLFAELAPKLAAEGRVTEAFNMKLYVEMVDPDLASKIQSSISQ